MCDGDCGGECTVKDNAGPQYSGKSTRRMQAFPPSGAFKISITLLQALLTSPTSVHKLIVSMTSAPTANNCPPRLLAPFLPL